MLAISLRKSKYNWITKGVFERYWIKPIKARKKDVKEQPELNNNPPKESMQKIGPCQIIIEPSHVFEAIMFAIRDVRPPPEASTEPNIKPAFQTAPTLILKPEPMSMTSSISGYRNTAQPPPLNLTPLIPAGYQPNNMPINSTPLTPMIHQANNMSTSYSGQQRSPYHLTPMPMMQAPLRPSQDPVIQMLAQRASSSPELKLLMKVVASGGANPEQLKIFQGHIDDLTAILERQKQAANPTNPQQITATSSYSSGNPSAINTNRFPGVSLAAKPNLSYQPPYQAPVKPKIFVPPKPEISGIAIEFAAGNGDRYLFPRHSIMEYQPGNRRAKATFVVVHKGNAAQGEGYSSEKEYYQPVTVGITSEIPRVMETLFKGVGSLAEARNHIDEIKAKHTSAESVHLAIQLPTLTNDGDLATLAERRKSLGDTLPKASIPVNEPKPTKASRRQDDLEQLCQYCFVSGSGQAKVDGTTVCQDCLLLVKPMLRPVMPTEILKHAAGRKSLMLAV